MQVTRVSNYSPKFTAYFLNDPQTSSVLKTVDNELNLYTNAAKNLPSYFNLPAAHKVKLKKDIVEELNKLKEHHPNTVIKLYVQKTHGAEALFAENISDTGKKPVISLSDSGEPMYGKLLSILWRLNNPEIKDFWGSPDTHSIFDVAISKTPCKVGYDI